MKQKIVTISVLTTAILAFSGCGSSNTTTVPVAPTTGTAFYLDSAVEGVSVTCGTTTSVTDVDGRFTYEDGKDCQFSVGAIALRTESGLYQDKVIIEDNIRTAQYLQSMDYDGNPNNGITIHSQTDDVMAQHDMIHVPANDQELAESVSAMESAGIGYHGNFVHEQEAQDHVDNTKAEHGVGAGDPNDPNHPDNNDPQPNDPNHPDNNDPQPNDPQPGDPIHN